MATLKYRKHQVLDGFTAFILCTKMSLCKIHTRRKDEEICSASYISSITCYNTNKPDA